MLAYTFSSKSTFALKEFIVEYQWFGEVKIFLNNVWKRETHIHSKLPQLQQGLE